MTRESLKIGNYTEEEIFQYLAGENGSALGRSMYDAIFDFIHALITEKDQLKKDKKTLQKKLQSSEKFAEKVQRENQSLKDRIAYLRISVERKEEQIADWQSDYVSAQSKIDETIEFIKEHITETEYQYVYSKKIKVIETLELNNEELLKLLQILERTDK